MAIQPLGKNKAPVDARKRRGGYYTPLPLAEYLAGWALRGSKERVLEPSCGNGNFVMALGGVAASRGWTRYPALVAVEIELDELRRARSRVESHLPDLPIEWLHDDFFGAYSALRTRGFDAVVGNPPFIRFQYFNSESRELAFHHLRAAGYHPTKLANAWAAFVQLSIELLKDGGRLAMVVPAELLQVKYAAELRRRLASHFDHLILVAFKKLIFPEIQQEVVLLLGEGKREKTSDHPDSDIHTIEFEDGNDLLSSNGLDKKVAHVHAKHSHPRMKWTALFLDDSSYKALEAAEQAAGLVRLGDLADVDVGVVTGRNSFFVLTEADRDEMVASRFTTPLVGRTSALKSIVFSPGDFDAYKEGNPAFVLNLQGISDRRFTRGVKRYILLGEQENVHHGYKCRIRRRWYDVPSIYVPDAFLFRQIHTFPLLVANEAGATSTDTIHRVRVRNGANVRRLAAACFNSLTLAWSEVCGRSYGGGVLELEPREAEELPIPWTAKVKIDAARVDRLLRTQHYEKALDYVDRVTLSEGLGMSASQIRKVRTAWKVLRDRRINRK